MNKSNAQANSRKQNKKIRRSSIKLYVEHQEKSWQNKETLMIKLAFSFCKIWPNSKA
jgi:hypothetical protein